MSAAKMASTNSPKTSNFSSIAPICSPVQVHLRTDRSITQFMLENFSNTPHDKIVWEDTLMGKTATYWGAREASLRLAHIFRHKYSVKPGDIVMFLSASCIDYNIAIHAVWAAGGTVCTVNHSSTTDDIVKTLELVKPTFIVAQGNLIARVRDAVGKSSLSSKIPFLGKCLPLFTMVTRSAGIPHIPELLQQLGERIEPSVYTMDGRDARQHCALIALSSGTTGAPKAAMLSHHGLVSICEQMRAGNPDNWRGDQREIFFPPLSHVYGIYVVTLMSLWLGYYVCMMPGFDLQKYCQLNQDKRATLARMVPTIAKMLAESDIVARYEFPDMEYFTCSAAPLKAAVAAKLKQRFPGVALCQTYGATELSGATTQSGVRDTKIPLIAAGALVASVKLRFIDDEGKDVPHTEPGGEICFLSDSIFMGYKDNAKATVETMLPGGWYRTGDIGYLNDDGYLIILDRIKDMIKYKGFQVQPAELEDLVLTHPTVSEVSVAAVFDDEDSTEVPRAFVVLREGTLSAAEKSKVAAEIRQIVDAKVAGYKKLFGGVSYVEQLPKSANGKVLRRLLPKDAPAECAGKAVIAKL